MLKKKLNPTKRIQRVFAYSLTLVKGPFYTFQQISKVLIYGDIFQCRCIYIENFLAKSFSWFHKNGHQIKPTCLHICKLHFIPIYWISFLRQKFIFFRFNYEMNLFFSSSSVHIKCFNIVSLRGHVLRPSL